MWQMLHVTSPLNAKKGGFVRLFVLRKCKKIKENAFFLQNYLVISKKSSTFAPLFRRTGFSARRERET